VIDPRAFPMKTNLHHLLLVSLAVTSVACAESNEGTVVPPDKITTDTGVIEVSFEDTAVLDTGTDTGSPVSDARPDGEACAYPTKETKPCGFCGTQTRTCLPEGVWAEFSECTDQRGDAECKVGDKRTTDCGNCGTQTDFCDVTTCTWSIGSCTGEGPCEKGAEESTRASCTVSGEVRVRTCDNKCQWTAYSTCGLPRGWLPMDAAPITGRSRHAAIWTGSKMIVWGGYGASPTTYKADGAAYDPASNVWTTIAAPPTEFKGRRDPHAVWTGSKMLVFGGRETEVKNDVAIYDPATDTWTVGAVSPLSKRWGAAYAWSTTTNELLVWGGYTGTGSSSVAGDGAAYNPTTNSWTLLPAAPIPARGEPNSAWTGTDLLVFAGSKADLSDLVDGARFNPVTRSWTKFSDPPSTTWIARYNQAAAWTGTAFAVWGGITTPSPATILGNGAIYTPLSGWSAIPEPSDAVLPPLSRRQLASMFHSSGKLYVFSGVASGSSTAISGMAAYDIATSTWTNVSTTNAPSARVHASVVWTGREAIVFGGGTTDTTSTTLNSGGIYRP